MRAPLVYLAHPIDLMHGPRDLAPLIHKVSGGLYLRVASVYRPDRAFSLPSRSDQVTPEPYVSEINRAALSHCHGLVAILPESATIGVGLEIQMAQELGIPTLVMVRGETATRSWSLAGLTGAKVLALPQGDWTDQDRDNLDQAVGWLTDQARRHQTLSDAPDWIPTVAMPLHVTRDNDQALLPSNAYPGDAGFDLYCAQDVNVPAGQFTDIPCGISVQLPPGTWGFITGRSSTLRKHELLVNPAVIDNGYRGPLYVGVQNLGSRMFHVKQGMRLAQLIPIPLTAANVQPVWASSLEPSERGVSGFGSSGE